MAELNLEFTRLQIAAGTGNAISMARAKVNRGTTPSPSAAAPPMAPCSAASSADSESTVLGAVVGGAIGTGIAARSRGQEVTLPEGIAVEIRLDAPFSL